MRRSIAGIMDFRDKLRAGLLWIRLKVNDIIRDKFTY